MSLSKEQIQMLLSVAASTSEDSMDCDRCFDYVAQFAETQLTGRGLCESMKLVKMHLQNCPCCKDEFQALLAAMMEVGGFKKGDCCNGPTEEPPQEPQ